MLFRHLATNTFLNIIFQQLNIFSQVTLISISSGSDAFWFAIIFYLDYGFLWVSWTLNKFNLFNEKRQASRISSSIPLALSIIAIIISFIRMMKFVLFFVSQALIKHKFQQKIGVSSYYIFQNFNSKSLFRYLQDE